MLRCSVVCAPARNGNRPAVEFEEKVGRGAVGKRAGGNGGDCPGWAHCRHRQPRQDDQRMGPERDAGRRLSACDPAKKGVPRSLEDFIAAGMR